MTGFNNGVTARLRENQDLTHMLNINSICHHLALACADSSSQITVLQDFEDVLKLWAFFKNSPKRLNIYAKTALKMHDLDTLPSNKCKKVVRKVKKAVITRWLILHASADGLYDEYVGLLETLNLLAEEKESEGAMVKGFPKKLKSRNFLGMLYTLKVMLPSLTALSKTFQSGVINFSRIVPNVLKTKTKLQQLFDNDKTVNLLKDDLQTRLRSCNLQINEEQEGIIPDIAERYVKAMIWSISERFPSDVLEVLEAFSIFDLKKVPRLLIQ